MKNKNKNSETNSGKLLYKLYEEKKKTKQWTNKLWNNNNYYYKIKVLNIKAEIISDVYKNKNTIKCAFKEQAILNLHI